jgi:phage minor structural protein
MQIYDDKKKRIGTLTGFKGRAITKTLDSGDKELSFEYPANGAMVDLLKEEYYIRTKEDEFVLKAVEAGEQYNKYTATLNVEELEGQSFPYGFASQEQTIKACLTFAFEGTGWTVGTCTVTKRRTIDIEEATTAWGVLQSCLSTYRCECEIDTLQKRINIYAQIGRDRGCYFVEGLNLRKLTATSDTYEFYTRIIPIGKEGITIEWLHGKEYLENYQYSSKVKTYTWKDERYTNTTSLIEDAEAKLEELSKPYKVYAADVIDLAKANPEYKDILDFGIGDTVMMVSKHPRMREKQRIVKIVEYPETPEKNTVELSNTTKTFAEVQKTETELAKTEAISIANSTTKKVLQDYSTTIEIETKITASQESIELGVKETLKSYVTTKTYEAEIKVLSTEISSKVAEDDFGTLITQNAYNVKIAWNKNSNYIQFEGTGITLYNGTIEDNQKRTVFNYTGMHFYLDGYYVGKIGTNSMKNNSSQKGLVFDLENRAAYMTWANEDTEDASTYTMKWSYCSQQCGGYEANMLHAGADIDMHHFKIKNVSWEGGGITATMEFVQVLEVDSDGNIKRWGSNGKMEFTNGILTDLTYYRK